MLRVSNLKLGIDEDISLLKKLILKKLKIKENELIKYFIYKESIDARKRGRIDFVYTVDVEVKNENKILEKIKIIFVCTVLFGGAMTAIMSFHSDAQMPAVFQNMYRIFFGVEASKPYIIYIPYSIGLAAGIIIFFNHFGMKKISRDPTPIEVEMTTYAKESVDSIIDRLGKEKNNGNN